MSMCSAPRPAGCVTACRGAASATNTKPVCIGQKQVWFLLKLNADESEVRLDLTDKPEFDAWRWVDFWYPGENVVHFKREVYVQALQLLSPMARDLAGEASVPKQASASVC